MSNYSRWKDTIEKHDREDGICPLLDDVYEQGRAEAIESAYYVIKPFMSLEEWTEEVNRQIELKEQNK